jgi:clan AA aspartic protease (TIGR02281 family)
MIREKTKTAVIAIFVGFMIFARITTCVAVAESAGSGKIEPDIVIITLNSGGKIKGVIIQENEGGIMVDLGYGTVGVAKSDIVGIKTPAGGTQNRVLKEWEAHVASIKKNVSERKKWDEKVRKRQEENIRDEKAKIEKAKREKEHRVKFSDSSRIMVDTVLNDEIKTKMLVDTGATSVSISLKMAKQLGVRIKSSEKIKVTLADGTVREGFRIVLKSVEVAGLKAENVDANAIEMQGEDKPLLGMSFLNRFHMRIDSVDNELVFKERSNERRR